MFDKPPKEKDLENKIEKLLQHSTDIGSSKGQKAQSLFLILQSLRSGRMVKYALWPATLATGGRQSNWFLSMPACDGGIIPIFRLL